MKDYKLYIFDWDGTLMDTTQVIADAIQHVCKKLGFNVVSKKEALSIIGMSAATALPHIVPEIRNKPELFNAFNQAYFDFIQHQINIQEMFPNAVDALNLLASKDKILAVATGKSRQGLDDTLLSSDLGKYFLITKTASECHSKPHPQMIEDILEFTGIDKSDAVMIGDTTHDINMANNAGVDSIALVQGAHEIHDIEPSKPTYIYHSMSEFYAELNK